MKVLFLIIIFLSCTTANKTGRVLLVAPLTNQQLTDSDAVRRRDILKIKKGFVFVDTNLFTIRNGVLTFKDSVIFKVGVFQRLYVQKPIALIDTLIIVIPPR